MGNMSLKAGPLKGLDSCLKYEPEGTRLLCRTVTFSPAVPLTGHILGTTVMIQPRKSNMATSKFILIRVCEQVNYKL